MPNQDQAFPPPPPQQAHQPGIEDAMQAPPQTAGWHYRAAGKLQDKVALITVGDSGIGSAVAIAFAKEGVQLAITYLEEQQDAAHTRQMVAQQGAPCLTSAGDIGDEQYCQSLLDDVITKFSKLDNLVNNAAQQHSASKCRWGVRPSLKKSPLAMYVFPAQTPAA